MVLQVDTTSDGSVESRLRSWQKPSPAAARCGGAAAVCGKGKVQGNSQTGGACTRQAWDAEQTLGAPRSCCAALFGPRLCRGAATPRRRPAGGTSAPASVLRRKATLLCRVLSEAYSPSISSGACSGIGQVAGAPGNQGAATAGGRRRQPAAATLAGAVGPGRAACSRSKHPVNPAGLTPAPSEPSRAGSMATAALSGVVCSNARLTATGGLSETPQPLPGCWVPGKERADRRLEWAICAL